MRRREARCRERVIAMLAPDLIKDDRTKDNAALPGEVLAAEREFYEGYAWCLNPHLTVQKAIEHLRDEIGKLPKLPPGWQSDEAVTNVYLLSCGLLNCIDEYLRGPGLRLPWRLATTLPGRCARWMADNMFDLRQRRRNELRQWRDLWLGALHNFLAVAVSASATEPGAFAEAGEELTSLLNTTLPRELLDDRVGIPSPFRRLDMTHRDVIALGERYVDRFPDRAQAILLVGLRTSGSYFAPLLRAFLANKGYTSVSLLTLSPSKGPGRGEAKSYGVTPSRATPRSSWTIRRTPAAPSSRRSRSLAARDLPRANCAHLFRHTPRGQIGFGRCPKIQSSRSIRSNGRSAGCLI